MQPFLNMHFVEFERERRGERSLSNDPDGFLQEEYDQSPDPAGTLYVRLLDWVVGIVRAILDRGADKPGNPVEDEEAVMHRTEVPAAGSD